MNELIAGIQVQARVVWALMLRETRTRYGNQRAGYLWSLLEPAIWITALTSYRMAMDYHPPQGMSTMTFIATGVVGFDAFRATLDRCLTAIDANKGLLFYPVVRPLDLAIARALLEYATTLVVLLMFLVGDRYYFSGELFVPSSVLQVVAAHALCTFLGFSLGVLLMAGTVTLPTIQRMVGPTLRPLFWISAVFFSTAPLEPVYRTRILWNPVVHCLELLRVGVAENYPVPELSWNLPLLTGFVLLFLGLSAERINRRRVELT